MLPVWGNTTLPWGGGGMAGTVSPLTAWEFSLRGDIVKPYFPEKLPEGEFGFSTSSLLERTVA